MKSSTMPERLRVLVDVYCTDGIEASDIRELEALLSKDSEARRYFSAYCRMHAELFFSVEAAHAVQAVRAEKGTGPIGAQHPEGRSGQLDLSPFPPSPSDTNFLGNAWTGAVGFFSQTGPLSYLVATVLFVLGMWFGSQITISRSIDRTKHDRTVQSDKLPPASVIGRITALADCKARQWSMAIGQWSEITNHKLEIINHKFSLGDRFAVASGLLEITYDTGAKVILEGPCTYEIDSDRGGYLAVGKLTAKVDKKAEGGRRRAEDADHYLLPTTHYPLFSVRTPTAVVTDLGTEFGVEVEESGATRSHVFQGSISIIPSPSGRGVRGEGRIVLSMGQSARVERGRNRQVVVIRESGQPVRFVRQISKSPSLPPNPRSLIAHYRLTDLGTLGGEMSCANAINDAGQVVGEAETADGAAHAFLYIDGKMKDLGALHGQNSGALDINSLGQVVGRSGPSEMNCRPFLYSNGKLTDLGTLGGRSAVAFAVNDNGHIVGASTNSEGVRRAFLYTHANGMQDLGALGGPKATSMALSVNAAGLVAGCSETGDGLMHAFLYDKNHGMQDIGARLHANVSRAYRVNDLGQLVGQSLSGDGRGHAFVYRDGAGAKILGLDSLAAGMNNHGQIVGTANAVAGDEASAYAFLHHNGRFINLNALIDPSAHWNLLYATAINDSGQIVGFGKAPNGQTRAFLLTPIHEGRGAGGERRGMGKDTNH